MPSIFVGFKPETFERLRRLAAEERRRPQDQAAVLVERALRAAESPPDAGDQEQTPAKEDA